MESNDNVSSASVLQWEPGKSIARHLQQVSIDPVCTLPENELVRLYRAIENALPDSEQHVIQFASAYNGEGANKIAFEMAVTAASVLGRRVLFIDTASEVQNGILKELANSLTMPLDVLLQAGKSYHDALIEVGNSNLTYTLLSRHGNGITIANMKAMQKLLRSLRDSYDLIVVATPDVLTDALSTALAKYMDGCVLVIEAERTRVPVVKQAKQMLEESGGKVIGAVLNKRRFYIPRLIYRLFFHRR